MDEGRLERALSEAQHKLDDLVGFFKFVWFWVFAERSPSHICDPQLGFELTQSPLPLTPPFPLLPWAQMVFAERSELD